ncbi:MAG TPA: class II glutamine amidotransferase [Burkholderiales bacterium]|nr:class II glutamine amidotransferase [Burkholderiales bacterium]
MCELFGLTSSEPVAAAMCLKDFQQRGGGSGNNPDGWGLVYKVESRFLLVKEPLPAVHSELYARVSATLSSGLIIAHVRKAKYPLINSLVNTHPFQHECCDKQWVFAHNGLIPEIIALEMANNHAVCSPDGQTDSEYAFCYLLGHIAKQMKDASQLMCGSWLETIAQVAEAIAVYGQFNFLLSDGDYLIAYAHDRLHYLERLDRNSQMETVNVALVATEPLSSCTPWLPFESGELRIYRQGRLVSDRKTHPPVPSRKSAAV